MHFDLTGIGTLALVALGIAANLILSSRSYGRFEQKVDGLAVDVQDIKKEQRAQWKEINETAKLVSEHAGILTPRPNGHGRHL